MPKELCILVQANAKKKSAPSLAGTVTGADNLHLNNRSRTPATKAANGHIIGCGAYGSAYGIRTRVSALRGQYPRPLDECAVHCAACLA